MSSFYLKKGLDIPIEGDPISECFDGTDVNHVALIGPDYAGLKPKFDVEVGDSVKTGQRLFINKQNPDVAFTAPGTGTVVSINRGGKRKFLSIVIQLDKEDPVHFLQYAADQTDSLNKQSVIQQLLISGLWTSFRSRPFDVIPKPDSIPDAIFVTAMDTHPLAASVLLMLKDREEDYKNGLKLLTKLTDGPVHVCASPEPSVPAAEIGSIRNHTFEGPHPAGNAGTHIHFIHPVDAASEVWYIHAEDVAHIGELFRTGYLPVHKVIALSGPRVKNPRHLKVRIGASIDELIAGQIQSGPHRVISGSILQGHTAEENMAFLGKYHHQISVIHKDKERIFFGWLSIGLHLYSVKRIVASRWIPSLNPRFNTEQHGGLRAIVPVGSYEKVMPLDIEPTYLLRALSSQDIDESEALGALELGEDDLALCTFVCPGKIDHGANLRRLLETIQKEG